MDFEKKIAATNAGNHFMVHNHIRLTKMEKDYAVVELLVQKESRNLFGGVHGGVFLTMADCAAGGAARSDGGRYVTLNNSFQFFRNTKDSHIRAEGIIRHRGRTICVAQVDVKDGADVLLASGSFTLFYTGEMENE